MNNEKNRKKKLEKIHTSVNSVSFSILLGASKTLPKVHNKKKKKN